MRTYITTPIYYVNAVPHVGTATTTLLADAQARYHRMQGLDTWFLTGTDEHAQKVSDAAVAAGESPQAFVDKVSQSFVEAWNFLDCRYDNFIRTSEDRHKDVVREVFTRLEKSGDIYLGVYEGWYSVADETFFRDTDVDENGIVKETGAKVERIREDVHYFRLSAYGDRLKEHILSNPGFLIPDTRRNEVLAFIEQGLRDIAISRKNASWGIEVPGDASKVIYVWFDALINYLTESGWPNNPAWDQTWPATAHLMAKEIFTRFHATLWPAMLMALDLPLPKHVVGHGWWVVRDEEGQLGKASKSKGNIPTPQAVVEKLVDASGAKPLVARDALRYYLLRDIRFSDDTEFALSMLQSRYNAELGNDLGNVLNRVLKAGYFGGTLPTSATLDAGLQTDAERAKDAYVAALTTYDWGTALQAVNGLLAGVNRYLAATAPWKAAKIGATADVETAVYNALEGVRFAAVLLLPAMPHAAGEVLLQLGLDPNIAPGDFDRLTTFGALPFGGQTAVGDVIFPRLAFPVPATENNTKTSQKAPQKSTGEIKPVDATTPTDNSTSTEITIDDFVKVQFRIADITHAEKIEGAKKLLRLEVKLGEEKRQIVSGIADSYTPEELIGMQIVIVYNLKPAKLRGVESQGMLLAATDEDGKAILLQPAKRVTSGAEVR